MAIIVVGFVFDFDYLSRIDPPLEYFTVISHPLAAIFYLGCFLIVFRHSYMLMMFVTDKAPAFRIPLLIIFTITILINASLIYFSFAINSANLHYPYEWHTLIGMEFFVLFWQFIVYFKIINKLPSLD